MKIDSFPLTAQNLPLFQTDRLIVSVFDQSGAWAKPYIDAGYPVILWDYKYEGCIIQKFDTLLQEIETAMEHGYQPYGLLMAPPCTDISSAGAQYWKKKDATEMPEPFDGWTVTDYSRALVEISLHLRDLFPWAFWALENPPGRMHDLVPTLAPFRKMIFSPYNFGDPYTKKTILWGQFNDQLERNDVEPETVLIKAGGTKAPRHYRGSHLWASTGGNSEKSRARRSKTPAGFAKAFFNANQ